jgi:hypothetical protein
MVAVVARHAEKSELFSAGERAHPTNERNKLENSVCGTSSDIQPIVRVVLEVALGYERDSLLHHPSWMSQDLVITTRAGDDIAQFGPRRISGF